MLGRELQQTEHPEDGINRYRNSIEKLVCDLVYTVVVHESSLINVDVPVTLDISTLYQ